jgi:prohibitin 1
MDDVMFERFTKFGCALMAVVALFFAFTKFVGPREIGVRVSLGKPSEHTLTAGFYAKVPFFYTIKILDTTIERSDVITSSSSKDMQEIVTEVAINWSIDPEKAYIIYTTIGDQDAILERILLPATSEILKSEMSKMTAEDILRKRIELKKAIDVAMSQRLLGYGIKMFDLSIINLSFSPDFSKAVEQKQIAEQSAKRAEYVVKQAYQEAQAEIERARGQAEAQKILQLSINDNVLELKALEKWDGKLPVYVGSDIIPFIPAQK